MLFRIDASTAGTSQSVAISADAGSDLCVGLRLGGVASWGSIRASMGVVDDLEGFALNALSGDGATDVGVVAAYTATLLGVPRDVVTLGGYGSAPFTPWITQAFAQNTFIMQLTTLTPEGARPTVSTFDQPTAGPIPGYPHRNAFVWFQHMNPILTRRAALLDVEALLAGGETVMGWGWAEVEPTTNPDPTYGVTCYGSETKQDLFYRKGDGAIRPWFGNGTCYDFTFAADADQALTMAQSLDDMIIVQDGVISGPRTITSQLPALSSSRQYIKNLNAIIIEFAWATGASVSIPSGEWAIVVARGGNAYVFARGV